MRRSMLCRVASAIVLVVAMSSVGLVSEAGALTCADQRDGIWDGVWTSDNPLNGAGTWHANLVYTESSVSGSVAVTNTPLTGGPVNGSITCNNITFGTVGGETTFSG